MIFSAGSCHCAVAAGPQLRVSAPHGARVAAADGASRCLPAPLLPEA